MIHVDVPVEGIFEDMIPLLSIYSSSMRETLNTSHPVHLRPQQEVQGYSRPVVRGPLLFPLRGHPENSELPAHDKFVEGDSFLVDATAGTRRLPHEKLYEKSLPPEHQHGSCSDPR